MTDEHAFRRPPEELRPFVSWCTGYRQDGADPAVHRGLPSPWLTLIVTLDDPLTILRHPDPGQPPSCHDTLAGGLHTSPALISHGGRQSGVQLGPGGPGAPGRIRPEVGYAWRRLRQTGGGIGVGTLAEETGWSARYLGARFRAETGLTPKAAARVFRFDRARRLLTARHAAGQRDLLGRLAADCGYYDQAHLAREFRDLAGCPPSVWLAEEFRFVQAAPRAAGE